MVGSSRHSEWLSQSPEAGPGSAFSSLAPFAFCTAYAYAKLAEDAEEAGGAFTFLRHIDMPNLAGGLAWVLLVGYVLTNAVYAFTFGEYVGNVVDSGPWLARLAGKAIVAVFVVVNLVGVGESSAVEIFLVWFKLVVLVSLAVWGIAEWRPELLSRGVPKADPLTAVFGAASVFMAYEGFQLLTYDYDDIEEPKQTLRRATLWAVGVVVVVYVGVAIGVPMIMAPTPSSRTRSGLLAGLSSSCRQQADDGSRDDQRRRSHFRLGDPSRSPQPRRPHRFRCATPPCLPVATMDPRPCRDGMRRKGSY